MERPRFIILAKLNNTPDESKSKMFHQVAPKSQYIGTMIKLVTWKIIFWKNFTRQIYRWIAHKSKLLQMHASQVNLRSTFPSGCTIFDSNFPIVMTVIFLKWNFNWKGIRLVPNTEQVGLEWRVIFIIFSISKIVQNVEIQNFAGHLANSGATLSFWIRETWIGNPAPYPLGQNLMLQKTKSLTAEYGGAKISNIAASSL